MSSFQDAVHKLSEWLKDENNKQDVLKKSLSFVMHRIMNDLGIAETIIYFNIECDRKGRDKVLSNLETVPDFLLISHHFLDVADLTLNKLQIMSDTRTNKFLLNFKDIKKPTFKNLVVKDLVSSNPYDLSYSVLRTLGDINNIKIDTCDNQNTLEVLSMCGHNIKVEKITDNNPFLIAIFNDSKMVSLSLPESIVIISNECFSSLTHPVNIIITSRNEISFQRRCFNHNVDHSIYIPTGTQVKCHREDKEYLKSHIKRY